jgi:hypothetical protein
VLFGRYEDINWEKLKSYSFKGSAPPLNHRLRGSCGTHALAHIMKESPTKIDKYLPKNISCWSTTRIAKFLRQNGYVVQPVTICNVTNRDWPRDHISKYHILLIGQFVLRQEGTWSVVWCNERYHSGHTEELDPYEFINNPLDCAFIVYHKKWSKRPGGDIFRFQTRLMVEDKIKTKWGGK